MNTRVLSMFLCCLLVVFANASSAQERGNVEVTGRAAQYHLGTENELLIPVNVWGFVRQPGQYLVPDNIDLITLLSFAGGPTEDGRLGKVKVVRSNPDFGKSVFKTDIKKYLRSADHRLIPILKPGDTVIVKGTTFHWFTRFFEFVSRMAVVAQIFYFVALAQEYISR